MDESAESTPLQKQLGDLDVQGEQRDAALMDETHPLNYGGSSVRPGINVSAPS